MTSPIHPSSTVGKSVKIGENVKIGPFCNIDGNIFIGDGTELKSHVSITGNTNIGKNNIFYLGIFTRKKQVFGSCYVVIKIFFFKVNLLISNIHNDYHMVFL